MAKKAVIVGINYVGTSNELQGCVNDATMMQSLLKTHFGFVDAEINMVLEKAATTAGIMSALTWLVVGSQPGDILLFHYSGHGSQVPSKSEPDGLDEIICPIDLDWNTKMITDDQLKAMFNQAPNGANVTVILDSCHSGTALDQVNEYQPQTTKGVMDKMGLAEEVKRYLPPPAHIQAMMHGHHVKQHMAHTRDVDQSVMLIAGCHSDQTSADAYIGGKYQGAATYALNYCLGNANYAISYKSLVECMNVYMVQHGYDQRPELDGASTLFDKNFLGELGVAPGLPGPAPTQPSAVSTAVASVTSAAKNNLPFVLAGVAVVAFLVYMFVLN